MSDIVQAEASDLEALCQLLAAAFHGLPPSAWLVADEVARRQLFPPYFQIYVENGLANGSVYTIPDLVGAAVWLPVGTTPKASPGGYHDRLATVTAPWTSRFLAFDSALEARYPVGRAHHHLAVIGVRPDRQGRGIGSALLETHHRQLDADGVPAYLEASSQASRKLYLRHGYEDLGSPIELPGGPSMFPMWREPRTGRDAS